jgi:Bacterial Ig-like domain (group 2)
MPLARPLPPPSTINGNLMVGGQGQYVRVTSSNVSYDAALGRFTFDVSLRNLIEQPLGTTDGTTLDPAGVRLFFHQAPAATSGTGAVTVVGDGTGFFSGPSQPYYQYNEVLSPLEVSPTRQWRLDMPPTVTTFNFTLLVYAAVPYPNGYVTLDGKLPGGTYGSLAPGGTHQLSAVVKTAAGKPVSGAVTFATSDPGCATVSGSGLVTAVGPGTCTITATSGARPGSIVFNVTSTTRTWTGAVSTDWSAGGNWQGGVAPGAADTVSIPTGVPRFPVLTSNAAVSDVTVADGATLDVGVFDLTSTGSVSTGATAGSGIVGSSGRVILAGTSKTMSGRFPAVRVSGTYSVNGPYWGKAPQTVGAGRITVSGFEMNISQ